MNKKIALFAMTAVLALPIVPAFAADSTTVTTDSTTGKPQKMMRNDFKEANQQLRQENQAARNQNQADRQALRAQQQANMQERCKNIQNRIDTQTNRYENNKQMFTTVFGNMQARLKRLSERLASKGIDVTKLNADIETLGEKIAKLQADLDAFVAGLKDAGDNAEQACEAGTKGEFMNKILGARKVSTTVQADRIAIRDFFQTTIKADITAIRKQIEAAKPTDAPKTTTPETGNENPTTLQPTL